MCQTIVFMFRTAAILLLVTRWSVLVHGIIDNLSYSSLTNGGVMYIFDGAEATQSNIERDVNHLQINLQYLYEIDSSTSVILRGHTLATTNFNLIPIKPSSIGGIRASVTTAKTTLRPGGGDIELNLYLLIGRGTLVNDDETFDVDIFDAKFNIILTNYQFCDVCPLETNRNMDFLSPLRQQEEEEEEEERTTTIDDDDGGSGRGEYIDVAFSVIGRTIRETGNVVRFRPDTLEFGLGGSITLVLSRKVNIDGVWMDMPDGFPALDRLENGIPVFVARFPRFNDTAFYDPLITTSREGLPTLAPTISVQPSSTPSVSFSPTLSSSPTVFPTYYPTLQPTVNPTLYPTLQPTAKPTHTLSYTLPSTADDEATSPANGTLDSPTGDDAETSPVDATVDSPTSDEATSPVDATLDSPTGDEATSPASSPVDTTVDSPTGDEAAPSPVDATLDSPTGDEATSPVDALDGPTGDEATSPVDATLDNPTGDEATSPADATLDNLTGDEATSPVDATLDNPTGDEATSSVDTTLDGPTADEATSPVDATLDSPTADEATSPVDAALDNPTGDEATSPVDATSDIPTGDEAASPGNTPGPAYVVPTCGDLSYNSAIILTAWNTFEDAIQTQGEEMVVDRHATLMRDGIEFPLFPTHSPDNSFPLILYDIDFTQSSITFTLRSITETTTHQVLPDGSFDRYYFDLGAPVADASIDRELTTIKSTVEVLPQGYTTTLIDPLNLRIVMPVLINGGILVSVLPGANLTELGQSIVICYSREDPTAVALEDGTNADGSVCGNQGSDSSIIITAWNTFEDAVDTEGKEVIWDTFGSPMSDGVEFHMFPSNPPDNISPWGFYDIDFTISSVTFTLRNASAGVTIFPEGSFVRYYFRFKGKKVTEAMLVGEGTTILSTVQILLPGFAVDFEDKMETGIVIPTLVNGGILVSIVPGAHIVDLNQKFVICFALEDGEEESTVDLGLEESDRSSSSRLHSFGNIGAIIAAGIVVVL